jgi:mono/diheme cytochrome c family protein
LFKSITEGVHRDTGGEAMRMPRWKDILSDQDRWDVLTYIRYLSKMGKEKNKNLQQDVKSED